MKTLSSQLQSHLQGSLTTLAWLWKVTRQDSTVFGFTDHDQDIVLSGITYSASSGVAASTLQLKAGANVDNSEVSGMLDSAAITDADILAGLWDGATVLVSICNWADLTQGSMTLTSGTMGNVTLGGVSYKTEVRSLGQALQQTVGRTMRRQCDANLGDIRCGVNMVAYTVTGSVTTVTDQQTLSVTAIPPGASATITGTVTGTAGAPASQTIRQIFVPSVAPDRLGGTFTWTSGSNNGQASTVNSSDPGALSLSTVMTHDIAVGDAYSITDSYTGGGVISWTSGLNNGLKGETKTATSGVITLALPMPYTIAAGDTYSVTSGCDKNRTTCSGTFNNVTRFRGFPDIPGVDAIHLYPNANG